MKIFIALLVYLFIYPSYIAYAQQPCGTPYADMFRFYKRYYKQKRHYNALQPKITGDNSESDPPPKRVGEEDDGNYGIENEPILIHEEEDSIYKDVQLIPPAIKNLTKRTRIFDVNILINAEKELPDISLLYKVIKENISKVNFRFTLSDIQFKIVKIRILDMKADYISDENDEYINSRYGNREMINILVFKDVRCTTCKQSALASGGTMMEGYTYMPTVSDIHKNFIVLALGRQTKQTGNGSEVYNKGFFSYQTWTHEFGHFFGLYHVHEDHNGTRKEKFNLKTKQGESDTGDYIADTPPYPTADDYANYPFCLANQALEGTTDSIPVPVENIMSYSKCGNTFSLQQADVMRWCAITFRTNLKQEQVLDMSESYVDFLTCLDHYQNSEENKKKSLGFVILYDSSYIWSMRLIEELSTQEDTYNLLNTHYVPFYYNYANMRYPYYVGNRKIMESVTEKGGLHRLESNLYYKADYHQRLQEFLGLTLLSHNERTEFKNRFKLWRTPFPTFIILDFSRKKLYGANPSGNSIFKAVYHGYYKPHEMREILNRYIKK